MSLEHHDRLDKMLSVLAYTDQPCGSLNREKGVAEYCGYSCPTLRKRMDAGDDPDQPINTWPPSGDVQMPIEVQGVPLPVKP